MQHGFRKADWLVEQLIARTNLVVWPELGYGYYLAFTDYPVSISLSQETYAQLVAEVLDGIEAAGARKMVILNTGVSTIRPLERMLEQRVREVESRLINVYSGAKFLRAQGEIENNNGVDTQTR